MKIYRLSQAEFRAWREHDTRADLMKRIFTDHGVAQVRAPSGHILGSVRQTNERVPIERAKPRAAHHAIRPGECMCREWQKPPGKDGEHHPICINKSAWESQQVHDPDAPRDRVMVSPTAAHEPAPATAPTEQPPAAPASPPSPPLPPPSTTPQPESCICHGWAGVTAGQHHALCQFRGPWEREHEVATPQLVELETGVVAREATAEEAAASKRKEPEDGVGAIELSDGKLYYVRTG